jgi:hypothetical protein
LFSRDVDSPKKRLKNSSIGSFEEREERWSAVAMLTTAGIVFLAIAANEGGRAPSSANAAAELLLVANPMNKLAQRVSLSHLASRG